MSKRKVKESGHISAKNELFAREYLVDLNATRAAMRAGYSEKTARQQGQRLLSNAAIAELIAKLKGERVEKTGDLATRVLRELELIGFADIGDVLTQDRQGKVLIRRFDSLTPEVRRTLSEVTQVTTEKTVNKRRVPYGAEDTGGDGGNYDSTETESIKLSIKQHNKLTALALLFDHLGLAAPKKLDHAHGFNEPVKKRLADRLAKLASG